MHSGGRFSTPQTLEPRTKSKPKVGKPSMLDDRRKPFSSHINSDDHSKLPVVRTTFTVTLGPVTLHHLQPLSAENHTSLLEFQGLPDRLYHPCPQLGPVFQERSYPFFLDLPGAYQLVSFHEPIPRARACINRVCRLGGPTRRAHSSGSKSA